MKFATELLHGVRPDKITGSTTAPIYQTAAYYQDSAENIEKIFAGRKAGFIYTRMANPTITNFENRIANLEHGTGAVSFASGMAAISASIMNIVQSGDEIISNSGIFGGTLGFFRELKHFGVNVNFVNENRAEIFSNHITNKTKLIYIETIGNPKLDVSNISALAKIAHDNSLPLFVDNTVTTPYLCRPLDLGADVVIHSTSKLINGHGNAIGGMVVVGKDFEWNVGKFPKLAEFEKLGNISYLARLRARILTDFGGCSAPANIFLTSVGLDTLALRIERACSNALTLAKFCSNSNINVNYPGLEDNHYHELAKNQFDNHYGTMITLKFGSKDRAFRFINALKFALNVSNIGDARTLVIHPYSTIYHDALAQDKINAGVTEDLVRVSVGIEDITDLIEDFSQALKEA